MNRIEAESTILKALYQLADPTRTEDIFSKLTGDHFTDSDNLKAFTVAMEGYAKNGSVPYTTKYYEQYGSLNEALDIIRTEHKRKRIADFCDEAVSKLMIDEPDKVLRQLSNRLDQLNTNSDTDPKPLKSHIVDLIADLKKPDSMLINVGIPSVDNKLGGFKGGQMIVVAARPGMGKSVFASQVAVSNAVRNVPVLFLSLEMSGIEIASRIVSGNLGISSTALQRRSLTDEDWDVLERAPDNMDIPMYIHDKADMDILTIRALIRKYCRSYGVKFVVVDYIGLINEPKDGNENREQQVARMSRFFKTEAKEQNIPIMVLAQLNREMEKRAVKKPQLSDLRESGSIEQDADTVIFLHRPELVGVETMPDNTSSAGKIIIDFAKRRSGTTGFVTAHFNGDKQKIGGESWEI